MGIGGISIWQLLIILAIVVLLFGTKKLKGMGSDLGSAVKGFKKAINDDSEKKTEMNEQAASSINDATVHVEKETEITEENEKKPVETK